MQEYKLLCCIPSQSRGYHICCVMCYLCYQWFLPMRVGAFADPVCPACLGVLQTPEGGLHAVPAAMLAGLPEAEANAGSWQTCTSASCHALAQCVRSECFVNFHRLACCFLMLLLYLLIACMGNQFFEQTGVSCTCAPHCWPGQSTHCCFRFLRYFDCIVSGACIMHLH